MIVDGRAIASNDIADVAAVQSIEWMYEMHPGLREKVEAERDAAIEEVRGQCKATVDKMRSGILHIALFMLFLGMTIGAFAQLCFMHIVK